MYSVSGSVRLVKIGDVPLPDIGSPRPAVLASDAALFLAYFVNEPIDWDDPKALDETTAEELANERIALIEFQWPSAHYFGAPNDETVHRHPLAKHGLEPYYIWEVENSPWIGWLDDMNSFHPHHSHPSSPKSRHFVIPFKDNFFECVAEGYAVTTFCGSAADAIARMTALAQAK